MKSRMITFARLNLLFFVAREFGKCKQKKCSPYFRQNGEKKGISNSRASGPF